MSEEKNEFIQFETCKYRSNEIISKKKCCSSGETRGYGCNLKKIFPLCPYTDCMECKEYEF
jgi:hypothetical protein